jgi:hypothetical protein
VPAVVIPEPFTETLTLPGTVPLAGEADSQEPPEVVAAAVVNAMPELPLTFTDCDGGFERPMV